MRQIEQEEVEIKRYTRAITASLTKEREKRLKKLMKIPKWISELTQNEEIEFLDALKRYQKACNRRRLKEKPPIRIQELAYLTNKLLNEHQMWYYEWLERDETYNSFFVPKRNALKYKSMDFKNLLFFLMIN